MGIEIRVNGFNLWYGENHALKDINMEIEKNKVTAIIGPSGCGKSTFIRSLNRMNDLVPSCITKGDIFFDGMEIYEKDLDVYTLRKRVGMVFQKPNPFPMSVYDNISYGPRIHGRKK
jgi:ABC-type phosphate transport system, ATPase component